MGKIPEEVYRAAKDDLEALWKRATEYGDFPTAREIIESEKLNFYYKTIDFEKVCFAWHDLIKAKFTRRKRKNSSACWTDTRSKCAPRERSGPLPNVLRC